MTKEEFNKRVKDIENIYKTSLNELNKECALENKKYHVGDIVEDLCGVVKITNISDRLYVDYVTRGLQSMPEVIYRGIDLRRTDLATKKNSEERDVYEHNVKRVIKNNGE